MRGGNSTREAPDPRERQNAEKPPALPRRRLFVGVVRLELLLARREGQESQVTRSLDSRRHAPLILGTEATTSARKNLSSVADESLECLHIFVVDSESRVVDSPTATILKTHVLNPPLRTW